MNDRIPTDKEAHGLRYYAGEHRIVPPDDVYRVLVQTGWVLAPRGILGFHDITPSGHAALKRWEEEQK